MLNFSKWTLNAIVLLVCCWCIAGVGGVVSVAVAVAVGVYSYLVQRK